MIHFQLRLAKITKIKPNVEHVHQPKQQARKH